MKLIKMVNNLETHNNKTALINTRLQPGGKRIPASEPFQRLAGAEKPLKRFGPAGPAITGLKPGVNEMASPFMWDTTTR